MKAAVKEIQPQNKVQVINSNTILFINLLMKVLFCQYYLGSIRVEKHNIGVL